MFPPRYANGSAPPVLVEALELELLLAGDALALIDDDFTLLDMVVDGLHGLGHGLPRACVASRFRVSVGMISGENRTSTARRPCGVSFSAERSFCVKAASTAGTSRISDTSGRRVSAFVSTSRTMIPFLEGRARRTSPTTPSRKRSSNHGKPVERTYSCTSGLIHWAEQIRS